MEKHRSGGEVSGTAVVGDLADRIVLVVDDLIAGGGTMQRAAAAFRREGAQAVYALATHGLFVGDAEAALGGPELEQVVVTDSVPPWRLSPALREERVRVVEVAPLLARAIERLHRGDSLSDLES